MVARYWTDRDEFLSELTRDQTEESDAVMAWAWGGELVQVMLSAEGGLSVLSFEADITNQAFRVGATRNRLRHGLWLEVPSQGHVQLSQFVDGEQRGFLATRGKNRYDFVGLRDAVGDFVVADDEPRWSGVGDSPEAVMRQIWQGSDAPSATWFSESGLLECFGSSTWMIGVDSSDGMINGVRMCSGEWLAEIPVSSVNDGIVRVTSLSDGRSRVLQAPPLADERTE